jgi:type I restriction enzyme R subunit
VVKELLETLKQEKLVLDWRRRQQSKAAVKVTIEEILDQLPESYPTDVYQRKCEEVYQHVYESYSGAGRSIYSKVLSAECSSARLRRDPSTSSGRRRSVERSL